MADLLVIEGSVKLYKDAATVPSNSSAGVQPHEVISQQLLINYLTQDVYTIAASAANQALPALPHAPYDCLLLVLSSVVRVNINSQGFQTLQAGSHLIMSLVNTVVLTNDQIPSGSLATVAVKVRYFAGRIAA